MPQLQIAHAMGQITKQEAMHTRQLAAVDEGHLEAMQA